MVTNNEHRWGRDGLRVFPSLTMAVPSLSANDSTEAFPIRGHHTNPSFHQFILNFAMIFNQRYRTLMVLEVAVSKMTVVPELALAQLSCFCVV